MRPEDAAAHAFVDVVKERGRQRQQEGWTYDHDDAHTDGSLALAAAAYAIGGFRGSQIWPWHEDGWKPKPDDRLRDLTRAGALILAEIERLYRAR